MKPLLSIVIPSNNRTELLGEALHSILAEPGFAEHCEICVSDNSSGEATQKLLAEQYVDTGRITYRRSLDSPSLDENVNRAVTLATGDYVWVFGDDDLIVPGFLPRLLGCLVESNPDIVIVNSRSFEASGVVEESRVPRSTPRTYRAAENDAFLEDLGGYLTYVGGIVIKKSLWLSNWRKEKVGTYFAHIDAVCRVKVGRTAQYLPQPGISMRLHHQTWTAQHFEIWNIHYPAIVWGLDGYSDAAKQSVIPRFPLKSLKRIMASRAYGRFDFSIWRSFLWRAQVSNALVRAFSFIISLLPRELFRLLYIIFIRIVRQRHSASFSPELSLAQLGRMRK